MNRFLNFTRFLLILLLLAGCSQPTAPTSDLAYTEGSPRPVVIDTDMAADDWLAILYLLQRPDVDILAITVSGTGEAHCEPGVRNALGLVALAGRDSIRVACGRQTPLQGQHTFPDDWRTSVDNLLGLSLPAGKNVAGDLTAVELLTETLRSATGKVDILTLGPLTNLAEVLQFDPALVEKINMVYVMGGAVHVAGNLRVPGAGIENDVAEWNVYVDPLAANVVFQSGVPVTMVGLDATNQVPLNTKFYQQMKKSHATPAADFVYQVLTAQKSFIDSGGYYFWDPLTAAILADESLAVFADEKLCVVEVEGPQSGWTRPGEDCPAVRVAVNADGERFESVFLQVLNLPSP